MNMKNLPLHLRVAVVDANLDNPEVAGTLGVAAQIGWDDAGASNLSPGEAMIESIGDRLARRSRR